MTTMVRESGGLPWALVTLASAERSVCAGRGPSAVIAIRGHDCDPGTASRPSSRAFHSPARSSEDLPVPEGATRISGPPGPPSRIVSR